MIDLSEKARQIESVVESAEEGAVHPLDLVEVVEEAVTDVRGEYPNVEIDIDLPEAATVAAIPAIDQAVHELCENACKHNDAADPTVEIAVERDGETVLLAVADDGRGIPEQEYSVLETGRETQLEHGSGLGLWLVHWIVTKSGGDLRFAHREPRGTTVIIELPSGDSLPEGR